MDEPICSVHSLVTMGTSFFTNKQLEFYRTVRNFNTTNYQGQNDDLKIWTGMNLGWNSNNINDLHKNFTSTVLHIMNKQILTKQITICSTFDTTEIWRKLRQRKGIHIDSGFLFFIILRLGQ